MTPMKAIRAKCLDCCCDAWTEVEKCEITKCPLYEYRFGKNPARALSPEKKEIAAKRMKEMRKMYYGENTTNDNA